VQRLDREAVAGERGDPVAVREVELDAVVVRVGDLAQPALVADEAVLRGAGVRRAQGAQQRVGEEDQPAAGAQQARRLGDPGVRVAPERRAVLGDREIEARVSERHVLGAGVDQRELEAVLRLHLARGGELVLGDVHAHRPRPGPRQPRRHVRGPAAQLDHVEALDRRQGAHLRVRDVPDPPRDLVRGPVAPGRVDVARRLRVPRRAVDDGVVAQVHGRGAYERACVQSTSSGTTAGSIVWGTSLSR